MALAPGLRVFLAAVSVTFRIMARLCLTVKAITNKTFNHRNKSFMIMAATLIGHHGEWSRISWTTTCSFAKVKRTRASIAMKTMKLTNENSSSINSAILSLIAFTRRVMGVTISLLSFTLNQSVLQSTLSGIATALVNGCQRELKSCVPLNASGYQQNLEPPILDPSSQLVMTINVHAYRSKNITGTLRGRERARATKVPLQNITNRTGSFRRLAFQN